MSTADLLTAAGAATVAYGDSRAMDQKAADQSALDAAAAELTATEGQLTQVTNDYAAYRASHPDAPVTPTFMVGVRADETTMSVARSQFGAGPTAVTRIFEQTLPPTPDLASQQWGQHFVTGQVPIVSFKAYTPSSAASYGKALLGLHGLGAYHHEPEADYGGKDPGTTRDPAKFIREWSTARDAMKAQAPGLPFGMIAGAFQYNANGGLGYDGAFIPTDADFYALDTYLVGGTGPNAIQPLETEPRFQRWYSFVKGKGKPLYITEYGRGLITDSTFNQQRADVIAKDAAYLRKIGVKVWIYWWTADGSGGATGKQWRFTDAASVTAWKSAAA